MTTTFVQPGDHATWRMLYALLGFLGLLSAGFALILIVKLALRPDEFQRFLSAATLTVYFVPGMLAAALSIQLLVHGRFRGIIGIFSRSVFPFALVAAAVAIVVPPRYNPPPIFYLAFGLTTYLLLLAGAVVAAVLNVRLRQ